MAHNNGMMPRTKGGKGSGKVSAKGAANTAKFRDAIQAAPGIAADPDIDPAYTAMPLAAMTGAELQAFVPHRPARPEKSEGGKKFKLVSDYEPAGD